MTSPIGSVAVEVLPATRNFWTKFKADTRSEAEKLGQDIGQQVSRPIASKVGASVTEGLVDAGRSAGREGSKTGEDFGAAFSKTVKARVEAALKGLPDAKIGADASELDKKVAAVRAELASLKDKKIGLDISSDEAIARVADLNKRIAALGREIEKTKAKGGDVPLNVDTVKSVGELNGLKRELTSLQREAEKPLKIKIPKVDVPKVEVPVETKLDEGSFNRNVKARLAAALKALPEAQIGVAKDQVEQDLKDIRARIATLSGKTVGVDIDEAGFFAEAQAIQSELDRLGSESVSVRVKTDAAAASVEMAKVSAEADKLGAKSPTINVDVDSAGAVAGLAAVDAASNVSMSGMQGLISAGIALGPAIVPAAAAAAAALAAIGGAALAGIAGIGVLGIALHGIVDAVKAMGEAETESAASGAKASAAQVAQQARVASATDGVKSAEAALVNARASAADAAARSAQAVVTAQAGVRDAIRGVASAQAGVRVAEKALADAQAQARVAQLGLTQARIDARRALADLNAETRRGALDQRQALLDVQKARQDLNKTLSDPRATQIEREQARLSYDQAVQRVEDIRVRNQRLAQDKARADKAGVAGSTQVAAAQDRIKSANQRVAQAQDGVVAANNRVAQANQRVATAQAGVAAAVRAQTAQQRQSAFSVEQAQQRVISAQRSLAVAMQQTSVTGSAAANKLQKAMAALSPAGQAFARFLYSLKPIFDQLKAAAQNGLFPGLTAGIRAMLPLVPSFTRFVGSLAATLGGLFAQAGRAFGSPVWRSFFDYLSRTAGPTLQVMARVILGFAQVFATLLVAFEPVQRQIGAGLVSLTNRLVAFVNQAVKGNGFNQFVAYVTRNGPILVRTFIDLAVVTTKLLVAFAPLGELVLKGLGALVGWLARLKPGALIAITAAVGAAVAAFVLLAGGPVAAVVAGIVAVVGALVYAYTHFKSFRDTVNAVWKAVAAGAVWLWRQVLQPAFTAWWGFAQTMARIYLWLWRNVLKPAFEGIGAVASWLWRNVLEPAFKAWWGYAQTMAKIYGWLWRNAVKPALEGIGAVALWLWRNVIKPAFQGIAALAVWLWDHAIKPAFEGWRLMFVKVIAPVIGWLWRNVVAPGFKGIAAVAVWLWEHALKPSFEGWKAIITKVIAPVVGWLWRNVVVPGFRGIGVAVQAAWAVLNAVFSGIKAVITKVIGPTFMWLWHSVIQPCWAGIKLTISIVWTFMKIVWGLMIIAIKALAAVFSWLWRNVVAPVWNGIKAAVSGAWNFVKPILAAIKAFLVTVLGPAFAWLYTRAVKPVWDSIKSTISTVWNKGVSPVFNAIKTAITKTLPDAFTTGVGAIAKAWDKVKATVRTPVEAVVRIINVVIDGYNVLAGSFNAPKATRINPKGFARGGPVPANMGTPGKDSVPALLMPGEHVLTRQDVNAMGGQAGVYAMRHQLHHYEDGGAVGRIGGWVAAAKRNIAGLKPKFLDKTQEVIDSLLLPGEKAAANIGKKSDFAKIPAGGAQNIFAGIREKLTGIAAANSFVGNLVPFGGFNAEQMKNAGIILSVGKQLGFGSQGWVVAIATALQESGLRNLGNLGSANDHDSLGLFQQRPSQGWGSPAQIMDPAHSSAQFYKHLRGIKGWDKLPVTLAAQAVQRSAFPNAYAKWEDEARQIVGVLTGTLGSGAGGGGSWNGKIAPGIIGEMQKWALAQRGKVYEFGAVGPSTFDCSGLVGDLIAIAEHKRLYRRYFLANVPSVQADTNLEPGAGKNFTVYIGGHVGDGHTAANIAGLHAEAYGGNGVPLAIGHVGTPLSYYSSSWHLPSLEGAAMAKTAGFGAGMAKGGAAVLNADARTRMDSFLKFGWPEPPQLYDTGGWLKPGGVATNRSGKPEAVFTGNQFGQLVAALQGIARTLPQLKGIASIVKQAGKKVGTAKTARIAGPPTARLLQLSNARGGVVSRLGAARSNLAGLQSAAATTRQDVIDKLRGSFNVSDVEAGASVTSSVEQLHKAVAVAEAFATNIGSLRKRGLDAGLIQQLIAAGPGETGGAAASLVKATQGELAQLNTFSKRLGNVAIDTGNSVANTLYGAGIKAAQGLVVGLAQQQKAIEGQMVRIAKGMVGAIKKALGIHSPSRVMAEVGGWTVQGVEQGIAGRLPALRLAVGDVASTLAFAGSDGYATPGLSLAGSGTGRPDLGVIGSQWDALKASGGMGGDMTLRVVVDDGAVRGLVRVEVDEAHGALADAHVYGTAN